MVPNVPAANNAFSQSASRPQTPFAQTSQNPASQPGSITTQPPAQSSSISQIPTKATGLPMPTAGTRKPSGPNQARGGGRGGAGNRGGRGQGRPSLNPSVDNFNPGTNVLAATRKSAMVQRGRGGVAVSNRDADRTGSAQLPPEVLICAALMLVHSKQNGFYWIKYRSVVD